jgi:cytoskeletal protein RodZ
MNFEELRSPSQQFIPSIREFFEPIIEQLQTVSPKTSTNDSTDTKEQSTKELDKERERMLQQDPSLVWRALRLLARQSPYFFVHNTQTVPSMAQFLVTTCEKIRREYITSSATAITPTTNTATTPPPATSTTNADEDDEDTTMDDEPLENPPSTGETTNTDQETEEEATTTTTTSIPKVDEDDDDDNRERRFTSLKRTSI